MASGDDGADARERPLDRQPLEFVTAFHSGAGGNRIVVLNDRIVAHYRCGGTSETLLRDIAYAGVFTTRLRHPTHGVYLVMRTPPYDTGFLFDEVVTCRRFLDTLRRRTVAATEQGMPVSVLSDSVAAV